MTEAQMIRYDRRTRLAEMRRKQARDTIAAAVLIVLALLAFGIAGTMEYEDEQREIERWQREGITLARGW